MTRMKWIDIHTRKPSLEDVGKEFLVVVQKTTINEYQIAKWDLDEDDIYNPYFRIVTGWCGQQVVKTELTHWCELPELPDMVELD